MLPWILLTCVALAATLYVEHRSWTKALWVTKPLASAGFLGAAWAAGAGDSIYGQAVLIALVWSFLGDVLLIPRTKGPAFLMGVMAFLMGHVGFVVAFHIRGVDSVALLIAAGGLAVPAWLVWRWLREHVGDSMRVPVVAYILVITLMGAAAVGTFTAATHWVLIAAAAMFYLSDLTVARQRFVAPSLANRLVGLPLYYAAQLAFAYTVKAPL